MTWESLRNLLFPPGEGSGTMTLAYWSFLVLLAGLEFYIPYFRGADRGQRWPVNLGLGLIAWALVPLAPVSAFWAAQWAQRNGFGVLNFLDASWWLLAVVATIAIQSLGSYAIHVIMHKTHWLWRVHRVHHLDTAFDVSTGLRHHPLEVLVGLVVDVALAIVFGLVPWVLMVYGGVEAMFALFTHANVKFPTRLERALRLLLVTPHVHAVHHSSHQPETDSNYGGVFTIWDRLFGTYRDLRAGGAETMQFGLCEVRDRRTTDLWWQLKSPALPLKQPAEVSPAQPQSSFP